MGTRSLASLLVFRAFASWRNKQSTDAGEHIHSLLALEEPESHLHPQAQRSLFSQVKSIPGQRIVSTHSPYFAGQAGLADLRLFIRTGGDTTVSRLDLSKLNADDIRKLRYGVVNTRGDLLFARAAVFFEGETEEQALPVLAEAFWGASVHELGFSFVRVGGAGSYFPFIWLAESLSIPWYVFSDGEPQPLSLLGKALVKAGKPAAAACPNVVVLPGGNNFESQLVAEGYLAEIEAALDGTHETNGFLDAYMANLDGKSAKGGVIRDYKSAGGRERAAKDALSEAKTRMAEPIAATLVAIEDEGRRFPLHIRKLFEMLSANHVPTASGEEAL